MEIYRKVLYILQKKINIFIYNSLSKFVNLFKFTKMILLFILIMIILLSLVLIECNVWSIGKHGGNVKIKYGGNENTGECNKCLSASKIPEENKCKKYVNDTSNENYTNICKCGHLQNDHKIVANVPTGAASVKQTSPTIEQKPIVAIGSVSIPENFKHDSIPPLPPQSNKAPQQQPLPSSEAPPLSEVPRPPSGKAPQQPPKKLASSASASASSVSSASQLSLSLPVFESSPVSLLESSPEFESSPVFEASQPALPTNPFHNMTKLIKAIHDNNIFKECLIEQIDKVIKAKKPLFFNPDELKNVFSNRFHHIGVKIRNNKFKYNNLEKSSNEELQKHIYDDNIKLKKILL